MTYVFISHSSHDRAFVNDLARQLEAANFPCWVDVDDIPDGSSWMREIEKAIAGCNALLVVMSEQGRASEWVEREVLLALDLGKPILFARLDDSPLPLYMINRQYTDFRTRPAHGIKRLASALGKVWKTPDAAPAPPKFSPDPNRMNYFKYLEQLPDGKTAARVARELFAWAKDNTDAITFTGRTQPAFHANLWIGAGGVSVFSVRAYPNQPAVEVPLQFLQDFPPYDDRAARLRVLRRLDAFVDAPFDADRADKRPNIPLAAGLGEADRLAAFIDLIDEIVRLLKRKH